MVMEKRKPRVVFPFTEAGMGHIMPLRAMADIFEKKYGDKVEVVRSQFFTETGADNGNCNKSSAFHAGRKSEKGII